MRPVHTRRGLPSEHRTLAARLRAEFGHTQRQAGWACGTCDEWAPRGGHAHFRRRRQALRKF